MLGRYFNHTHSLLLTSLCQYSDTLCSGWDCSAMVYKIKGIGIEFVDLCQ